MDEREKIIRLWFDMWLTQQDLGIDEIFSDDVIYIESWCPKYENRQTVKHWFNEWKCSPMCFIIAGDTSSTMSYHDAEKE